MALPSPQEALLAAAREVLAGRGKKGAIPEGWDGSAATRIADAIVGWDGKQR